MPRTKYNQWNAYIKAQKRRAKTGQEKYFLELFYMLFPRVNKRTLQRSATQWIRTKNTALDTYRKFRSITPSFTKISKCVKYSTMYNFIMDQMKLARFTSTDAVAATGTFWFLWQRMTNKQLAHYTLPDFIGNYFIHGRSICRCDVCIYDHDVQTCTSEWGECNCDACEMDALIAAQVCTGDDDCKCSSCMQEEHYAYYLDYADYIEQTLYD